MDPKANLKDGKVKNRYSDAALSACVALASSDQRIVDLSIKQMKKFMGDNIPDLKVLDHLEHVHDLFSSNTYMILSTQRPGPELK